jgi:hypothetical protein
MPKEAKHLGDNLFEVVTDNSNGNTRPNRFVDSTIKKRVRYY